MSYQQSITKYLISKNPDLLELITEHDKKWNSEIRKSDIEFSWGKYKNRDIKEVFDFDQNYCEWYIRQQYCAKKHRQLIEKLIGE